MYSNCKSSFSFLVTPNDNSNIEGMGFSTMNKEMRRKHSPEIHYGKSNGSPGKNTRHKQETQKMLEMTIPLDGFLRANLKPTHEAHKDIQEKRRRVKNKTKENNMSILEANTYLFSTKSNELVSTHNKSPKKSLNDLSSKEFYSRDNYNNTELHVNSSKRHNNINGNITTKHKNISKSSPHLENGISNSTRKTPDKKQKTNYQRSNDKNADKNTKDKDDTESGIDIPEPDYSPILIRRNGGIDESIEYDNSNPSPAQKKETTPDFVKDTDTKDSNPGSPTLWENAARYRGSLEKVLGDDDEVVHIVVPSQVKKESTGYNIVNGNVFPNINIDKSLPHTVTQNLTKEKNSMKQPMSINYPPNHARREEDAIISLENALSGRPRVKDMVERIRKETERDKVRQELRRSAFLVSQCQTNEGEALNSKSPRNSRVISCSGSSEGISDEGNENRHNKENLEDDDLIIEDLEVYGNQGEDDDDKEEEAIDIYKDLISVALEQEKLEDMRQMRAKSNGSDYREQQRRIKKSESSSSHAHRSNNASELSIKSPPTPTQSYSSKGKRRIRKDTSGSGSGRMIGYDHGRSRPNSANYRRSEDSLSPERFNLSATTNGNYSLSYSQDILSERSGMYPQSIMRSQPNINLHTNPEISSYPDGSRNLDDGKHQILYL